jgi:hypothetical protein
LTIGIGRNAGRTFDRSQRNQPDDPVFIIRPAVLGYPSVAYRAWPIRKADRCLPDRPTVAGPDRAVCHLKPLNGVYWRDLVKEADMSDRPLQPRRIEKSATEARQGQTPGVVRWVLLVSTVAAIVALVAAYTFS